MLAERVGTPADGSDCGICRWPGRWSWSGKRRWFCDQGRCSRRTFSEVTDQVPAFARSTARLCQALVTAMVVSGRPASEVARAHRVSWWLVQSMLTTAADLLTTPDDVLVRRLGVDEHRYRSVRFFREPDGAWRRYEPWMTTLVDTDTGRVLGVVDGRDSAGVGTRLATPAARRGVTPWRWSPSTPRRHSARRCAGTCPRLRQRGRLPPGQAGQRRGHRRPPAGDPRGQGPPRTLHRPGLKQPAAAAARRKHPQPESRWPDSRPPCAPMSWFRTSEWGVSGHRDRSRPDHARCPSAVW